VSEPDSRWRRYEIDEWSVVLLLVLILVLNKACLE